MTHELFISYSTENKDAAEAVVSALEGVGFSCWMAPRDIQPGKPYGETILQAIDASRVFLLLLSDASNKSRQVLREIDHAAARDLDILPVLIEQAQPSGSMAYYLGPEQWLDASSPPLEAHIERLVKVVRQLLVSDPQLEDAEEITEQVPQPANLGRSEKVRAQIQTEDPPSKQEEQSLIREESAYNIQVNPFSFGNPVFTRDKFFGREGDIRQVISRLLSAGESTSIVGERRIGKTSLLKFLSHPNNSSLLGLPPERFCLVYIDFQGLTDITPHRFWQRVLRKMEDSICNQELVPAIRELRKRENFDLFDLEDLFGDISNTGITTVLLMDEFEYVTQNPNFGSDFFGGLRALAIHRDLPLITGTRRELIDLCHSDEIKGSPFFNIFVNLVLRPFSEKDIVRMLEDYTGGGGAAFNQLERETIIRLSGGYPFFVQMAGYYTVEAKWKGLTENEVLSELKVQFATQAEPHFNYFWSHSSESEKITMFSTLTLGQQKPSPKTLPTLDNLANIHSRAHVDVPELIKRGLLLKVEDTGTYTIFSSSFEHWITREITVAVGQEESQESVEAWVRSEEYEDLEAVEGLLPNIKKKYWPLVSTVANELSYELAGAAAFELIMKVLL